MALKDIPYPGVFMAWAAEVSLAQLSARILAYAETKAVITTFRLVVEHAKIGLPDDVNNRQQCPELAFMDRIGDFVQKRKCLMGQCDPLSHFPPERIAAVVAEIMSKMDGVQKPKDYLAEDVSMALQDEADDLHDTGVVRYCRMLTTLTGGSQFAKAVQCFTADFKLRPYFLVQQDYDDYGYTEGTEAEAKAYLTLPVHFIPFKYANGEGSLTFSVRSPVDRSALKELSEEKRMRFTHVSNLLHLHPFDDKEDEGRFDEEIERARSKVLGLGVDFEEAGSHIRVDHSQGMETEGDTKKITPSLMFLGYEEREVRR
ncbi:MAG: hypothetical protein Q9170_004563 [Blastenia crenularia]